MAACRFRAWWIFLIDSKTGRKPVYFYAAAQTVLASLAMDAMRKGVEGNSTTAHKIAR
jgi:hypothetical protein